MRKKQLALEVIERLKKEYPDAHCTRVFDTPKAAEPHKLFLFLSFLINLYMVIR